MKGKFTYLKLLCCLFISIFIFGFGGEVRAESFGSRGKVNYRPLTYFQRIYIASTNEDVYCLNAEKKGPEKGYFMQLQSYNFNLSENVKTRIIDVLINSESLDVSDAGLKYYLTQAAIWYVKDGVYTLTPAEAAANVQKPGISQNFLNWIRANYSNEWNHLLAKPAGTDTKAFSVISSKNEMTLDGDYYYSEYYTANSAYKAKIDSGSSEGACFIAEGSSDCVTELTSNKKFKVRLNKPGTATTVKVNFTVTPQDKKYEYDLETFAGVDSDFYYWQGVTALVKKEVSISKKLSISANHTVTPIDIEIQKVDADTNKKVAGAKLVIKDADTNNAIGSEYYVSTAEGETNPIVKLPEGNYVLYELEAPDGYVKNDDSTEFSIVNNGGVLKAVDKDGNDITGTPVTISISNYKNRIKFRKVDNEGNPVAGLTFEIISYADALDNVEEGSMLCAVTDSDGLLTIPCEGDRNTNNVRSDGIYTLGVDFGSDSDIYIVNEYCEQESCKMFASSKSECRTTDGGYSSDGHSSFSVPGKFDFHVKKGISYPLNFKIFNENIKVEYDEFDHSAIPLITMTFVNNYSLKIKKVDITSGNEIAGAHLTITDPEIKGDNVFAEWDSVEGQDYTFTGIQLNHKYRLTEEVAPDGYVKVLDSVKMVNSIDFSMDADGNVKVYDIETGDEISSLKGTNYELLIKNMQTKTQFSKVSAVTGEEIEGAHLKVCTDASYRTAAAAGEANNCNAFIHPNTNEKVEWVSEAGKTKTIEALPAGNYYLVETIAPVGYYTKTSAVSFTVKDDGTIDKIEMENKPTKVVIAKLDQVTKKKIAGAHMQILNASDRSVAKDYNGDEATWVSKEDEDWTIYGLPVGEYILVESIVPEGYQEGMIINDETVNEYKFTVEDEEDELYLGVYVEVLNAPNTGISTLNLFAIGGLMVFAGYETIKIYRRKALN